MDKAFKPVSMSLRRPITRPGSYTLWCVTECGLKPQECVVALNLVALVPQGALD